jgi:CRP-like cAMP-binding protein
MLAAIRTSADYADTVRNIPLFSSLPEEELEKLTHGAQINCYARNEYIFRQGDPVEHIHILCDGIVKEFRKSPDGCEFTTSIYESGDMFCKAELFLKGQVHRTHTVAVNTAYVLELPIQQFKECVERHDSIFHGLLATLAQYAFMKQLEVEQHLTMTTAEKVANFLKGLCASHGFDPQGFTLPYKKSLIASRLGIELETLSRVLPKLKELGIIVNGMHVSFSALEANRDGSNACAVIDFDSEKEAIIRHKAG